MEPLPVPLPEPDFAEEPSFELFSTGRSLYPRMIQDIRAARETVLLEMYIFRDDAVGRAFREALVAAAGQGTEVRVLYDSLGCRDVPAAFFAEMAIRGVRVREFNPISPFRKGHRWRRFAFHRRDHRKLLVVDGRICYVGGINIGEAFLDWEDLTLRLVGGIARDAETSFHHVWTGTLRRYVRSYVGRPGGGTRDLVLCDGFPSDDFSPIVRTYLAGLKRARSEVRIVHAYFYPSRRLRKALVHLVRRGVEVLLIIPKHTDIPAQQYAAARFVSYFLRRGVRIFQYGGAMLHAKVAVVDRRWATAGSANLDPTSFYLTLELNLVIRRPEIVEAVAANMDRLLASCTELTLDAWKRRPLWHKFLERFFYRLRRLFFPGGG